jgi:CheY-like chemotaxis protein
MKAQCSIPDCMAPLSEQADGWVYLNVFGPIPAREGALCPRHAYSLSSLLNGGEVVVPVDADLGDLRGDDVLVRRSKILLVDDDVAITDALCELLSHEGYDVALARNGEEALATLRADSDIGLIILDLMMPGMDGWSFRRVQRKDPQLALIPVIVISAMAGSADVATPLDPAAVVPKPINVATLLERVELLC